MMTFTESDFEPYVKFLGEQESQDLIAAPAFADKVANIAEYGDNQWGTDLPWDNVSRIWKLRPSELTIWAGINGHGKSLLNGQVMLNEMKTKRVVIASLEMLPEQTLYRMACQFSGCRPDPMFAARVVNSMQGRLWLYDQQNTVDSMRILGMVLYCAEELKADHVVVDSLLKCGVNTEDFNAQKDFVDRLQWIAKSKRIHIHLICHLRKKQNENEQTSKFDVKGSGAITDLGDNVVLVSRNKLKEKVLEKQKNKIEILSHEGKYLEQKDAYVTIEKNRHGQKEGTAGLYFDPQSMQYTTVQKRLPEPWEAVA